VVRACASLLRCNALHFLPTMEYLKSFVGLGSSTNEAPEPEQAELPYSAGSSAVSADGDSEGSLDADADDAHFEPASDRVFHEAEQDVAGGGDELGGSTGLVWRWPKPCHRRTLFHARCQSAPSSHDTNALRVRCKRAKRPPGPAAAGPCASRRSACRPLLRGAARGTQSGCGVS